MRAWFAASPGRGDALTQQIPGRGNLARVAAIPPVLTIFCLLTDEPISAKSLLARCFKALSTADPRIAGGLVRAQMALDPAETAGDGAGCAQARKLYQVPVTHVVAASPEPAISA